MRNRSRNGFRQQTSALSGVVAVPTTPFAPDGRIDDEGYRRAIRRLVDGGITTVTPNGNTGEFYALSPKEASVVTRLAIDAVEPGTTVIVGVGHDLVSACDAARGAQAAGASMVMVHQPVHPYVSVEGWIEYHRVVAAAVPETGLVLYVRNAAIPGAAFGRLGELCPNVIGVKYAVADTDHFRQVAADAGGERFTWVAGLAELSAPGYFAAGATGFTSGLANVNPDLSLRLWRALAAGDGEVAAQICERVRPFEELRAVDGSGLQRLGGERGAIPARSVRQGGPPAELAAPRKDAGRCRRNPRGLGLGRVTQEPGALRSAKWFEGEGLRAFSHRSRARQLGIGADELAGKPVIGILNTWSEVNPCHMHLRERAQAVKRGVWEAGGYPLEIPVATLSETFQKPTPMLYRNLLAMDTEEVLRSYPLDGAVLMGGCDKTTPALLMGAASADRPVIYVPAGPMLTGHWHGESLGSGTDMWRFWDEKRAGRMSQAEWESLESALARSPGQCMTMGTASTMTSAAEALGMTLPGASSIPAVDSAHHRMAAASGSRIVAMVREDLQDVGDRDQGRPSSTP